jgi:hypothetical protein
MPRGGIIIKMQAALQPTGRLQKRNSCPAWHHPLAPESDQANVSATSSATSSGLSSSPGLCCGKRILTVAAAMRPTSGTPVHQKSATPARIPSPNIVEESGGQRPTCEKSIPWILSMATDDIGDIHHSIPIQVGTSSTRIRSTLDRALVWLQLLADTMMDNLNRIGKRRLASAFGFCLLDSASNRDPARFRSIRLIQQLKSSSGGVSIGAHPKPALRSNKQRKSAS